MYKTDRKGLDGKILRRTLSFVAPFKGVFILTGVITILLSFMAPLRTLLIKYAIDDNIQNGDKEGLKEIIFFFTHSINRSCSNAIFTSLFGQLVRAKCCFKHA